MMHKPEEIEPGEIEQSALKRQVFSGRHRVESPRVQRQFMIHAV
jgi:hypothetical protein